MPSAKGKPTDPKLKEKVTEGTLFFIYHILDSYNVSNIRNRSEAAAK